MSCNRWRCSNCFYNIIRNCFLKVLLHKVDNYMRKHRQECAYILWLVEKKYNNLYTAFVTLLLLYQRDKSHVYVRCSNQSYMFYTKRTKAILVKKTFFELEKPFGRVWNIFSSKFSVEKFKTFIVCLNCLKFSVSVWHVKQLTYWCWM